MTALRPAEGAPAAGVEGAAFACRLKVAECARGSSLSR